MLYTAEINKIKKVYNETENPLELHLDLNLSLDGVDGVVGVAPQAEVPPTTLLTTLRLDVDAEASRRTRTAARHPWYVNVQG